nr:hypothetical protein Iba_chr05eCG6100 [Ipomoea batatas]
MPWREASLAGSSPSPPPIHHRPRYDFQSQVVLGDNTVIKMTLGVGFGLLSFIDLRPIIYPAIGC